MPRRPRRAAPAARRSLSAPEQEGRLRGFGPQSRRSWTPCVLPLVCATLRGTEDRSWSLQALGSLPRTVRSWFAGGCAAGTRGRGNEAAFHRRMRLGASWQGFNGRFRPVRISKKMLAQRRCSRSGGEHMLWPQESRVDQNQTCSHMRRCEPALRRARFGDSRRQHWNRSRARCIA